MPSNPYPQCRICGDTFPIPVKIGNRYVHPECGYAKFGRKFIDTLDDNGIHSLPKSSIVSPEIMAELDTLMAERRRSSIEDRPYVLQVPKQEKKDDSMTPIPAHLLPGDIDCKIAYVALPFFVRWAIRAVRWLRRSPSKAAQQQHT